MSYLPTTEDYINAVAMVMKIKPEELGKSINLLGQPVTRNSGVFPRAREICAEAMHTTGRFSMPEIAKAMGLPNHSTVITARNRLRGKMVDGKYPDDISIQLAGVEQLAHVNAQKRMENADHGNDNATYAEGVSAGKVNKPNNPPKHLSDQDRTAWIRGWQAGRFEYLKSVVFVPAPTAASTAKPSSSIESKPLFK